MTRPQFQKFAFGLLIYTLLVILWGAWVRISHSGDGCGDTWPLCNGQLIPEAEQGKTWVEYTHRLMSGIYGLIVIYFWWVGKKLYPPGHLARKAVIATLIFMVTEALLGAKLVLFGLVTTNDTPYRAFVMALHQLNSFMLTGSVALAFASANFSRTLNPPVRLPKYNVYFPWILVILGITGAWASLSNSLFPTDNLLQAWAEDFSSDSHFLVRLRVVHPVLAILGAGGLALYFWIKGQTADNLLMQRRSLQMSLTLVAGVIFGIATLLLHAPLWMKVVHLGFAHTMWVLLLQYIHPLLMTEKTTSEAAVSQKI